MFCSKCGTQNDEASAFCSKCGNGLKVAGSAAETQSPAVKPKKKKSKILLFILAAVAAVAIAFVIMDSDSADYVATVGSHSPFQEMPHTYANVLSKYIDSASWKVRKSGNIGYVDISGTAKGTNRNIIVSISVTPDPTPDRPNRVRISTESLTIGDRRSPSSDAANEFLTRMFTAYDMGMDDISLLF